MEETPPAPSATDAQAASMEVAAPAGPDAKPPAPTLDAPQPTEAKPPKLEISPRAWAERERDKDHDIDEVPSEVTAETVLECLRRCEVQENEDRKNVRTDEDVAVRSITLGALSRSHAPARPSGWTRRQPRLARLLAEFGDKILPEGFPFASIQLNYAYASAMHQDKSNDGPSAIIALGEFTGGELWTADRGVLPCRNELRLFNGNQPHCTLPFKGERYSLIYFSSSGHDRMAPKDVQQCEALGFCRLPTAPLSHVYRPAEFATPHKEFEYTYGYHVCCGVLHAIDARRVQERSPWLVSFSISGHAVEQMQARRWRRRVDGVKWWRETHTQRQRHEKNTGHDGRALRLRRVVPKRVARGLGAARDAGGVCSAREAGRDVGTEQYLSGPQARLRAT